MLEDDSVARVVVLSARFLVVRPWGWPVIDHLMLIHATQNLRSCDKAKSSHDLQYLHVVYRLWNSKFCVILLLLNLVTC